MHTVVCAGVTVTVLEPEDWGMRWKVRPYLAQDATAVVRQYVHHQAGADPAAADPAWDDEAPAAFRALNDYAIDAKGYRATDYSTLVHLSPDRRVTVGIARGPFVPAATLDDNQQSKAHCLMGYFHPGSARWSRPPEDRELAGLAVAIYETVRRGWAPASAAILGHRDNPRHPNATPCPGDYLYRKLPTVRSLVAELTTRKVPPMPKANTGLIRFRGAADVFTMTPEVGETLRRQGLENAAPLVLNVTPAELAAIERNVGYQLYRIPE